MQCVCHKAEGGVGGGCSEGEGDEGTEPGGEGVRRETSRCRDGKEGRGLGWSTL